jgi:FKBP-type peptidyl-prolyl cis-trans isomerase FkpA
MEMPRIYSYTGGSFTGGYYIEGASFVFYPGPLSGNTFAIFENVSGSVYTTLIMKKVNTQYQWNLIRTSGTSIVNGGTPNFDSGTILGLGISLDDVYYPYSGLFGGSFNGGYVSYPLICLTPTPTPPPTQTPTPTCLPGTYATQSTEMIDGWNLIYGSSGYTIDPQGFLYQIMNTGNFVYPTTADTITVTYQGKLMNNTIFDQFLSPVPFVLNQLILGWQYALPLIGEGGQIRFIVPASLAYGCQSVDSIPSNSPLAFTVNLISVTEPAPTPTETPTNTPTPSTTPIPVTGYGYDLVVLPYAPPTSGNTIFPTFATPSLSAGTTNPNTFTVNGVYWNPIDSISVDRTSYYSGMTGTSVTAYFTQNLDTAIYSGSSTAFTFEGSPGTFNYNPNTRPGQLTLIQSASTDFVTGQTVYISYVVN